MTTLIESGIALDAIAKATKIAVAKVEADARELDMFVGCDWAGRSALSVTDAARMVSGDARREHDHAKAHRRWRASSEAWEVQRESVRQQAYNDRFDTARRRGIGDPQAAHEAAQVAGAAATEFESTTPPPTFGGVEPSRLSQVKTRVKESVLR
ncbi:MAG: hypothetical protein H0W95_00060 [Nocardioidaceae bacterium]|nr:hypothetical protein [Nocardioidaceae bacterium]